MNDSLEHLIRSYVQLPSRTNGGGWYQVLCKVCNDHGKKGKRAGFKFESNGNVGYHCFNCSAAALFDPSDIRDNKMPQKMATVLEAFGIPEDQWQPIIFDAVSQSGERKQSSSHPKRSTHEPLPIILPPTVTPINPNGDEFDLYAIDYLKYQRGMDWQSYPFYIGRKTDDTILKRWYGRLIIPIFKEQSLIYFQGRDLTDTSPKKYLNADIPRENVLFGYENIMKNTNEPLYIVEGWFDAWHLNGVSVFGNTMSNHHVSWINRSGRPKVIIPDKFGDGQTLAEQGIELGWAVSTPDWGDDVKDVNEAIMKYGLAYTLMTIKEHTSVGYEASVKVNLFCKG